MKRENGYTDETGTVPPLRHRRRRCGRQNRPASAATETAKGTSLLKSFFAA
jgi:hypothetical protein